MNYKAILFDLDGTLIDTTPLIIESFKHTVAQHLQRELDPAEAIAFFGKPLRDAMEYLAPDKIDELTTSYREFNHKNHDQLARSFAGVAETILRLHNAGMQLAIVTSKKREMALRGLTLFNMDKYFDVIIGLDQTVHHKPDPEPVLAALQMLQLAPEDCLMVGDSPFDIRSARLAGVKTAAVKWSAVPWETILLENPDYILQSMDDLLAVCNLPKSLSRS